MKYTVLVLILVFLFLFAFTSKVYAGCSSTECEDTWWYSACTAPGDCDTTCIDAGTYYWRHTTENSCGGCPAGEVCCNGHAYSLECGWCCSGGATNDCQLTSTQVFMPGNTMAPNPYQNVTWAGVGSSTANPHTWAYFSFYLDCTALAVSTAVPSGYTVGYSMDSVDNPITMGNSVVVNGFEKRSIFWHFYPPPTCSIAGSTQVELNNNATYTCTCTNTTSVQVNKRPTSGSNPWSYTTCAGTSCPWTTSFGSSGSYYMVCNGYNGATTRCSGNPWCSEWSPVATPEISCSPAWSDCGANDVMTVCTLPNHPTTVSCTNTRYDGVMVSWNDTSTDETGFRVARDIFSNIVGNVGVGVTNYLDTSVACGASHSYNVYPYNSCNENTGAPGCNGVKLCPTCTVSFDSNPVNIIVGETAVLPATVNTVPLSSPLNSTNPVVFSTTDTTSSISISPLVGVLTGFTYNTNVTGLKIGNNINITATANLIGGGSCSGTKIINVVPPGPWWRVVNADVTSNSAITSLIPQACTLPACNPVFDVTPDISPGTGFPGVPLANGGLNLGSWGVPSNRISSTRWNANTTASNLGSAASPKYDYNYFATRIPQGLTFSGDSEIGVSTPSLDVSDLTTSGVISGNYRWFHVSASSAPLRFTGADANLLDDKIIILSEGRDINIEQNITFNHGKGLFMIIVGKNSAAPDPNVTGNIRINSCSVTDLSGIYLAENKFYTNPDGNSCPAVLASKLTIRGSVVAYGGLDLRRNLGNSNTTEPAEEFIYEPSLLFTFPTTFSVKNINWKETAPSW